MRKRSTPKAAMPRTRVGEACLRADHARKGASAFIRRAGELHLCPLGAQRRLGQPQRLPDLHAEPDRFRRSRSARRSGEGCAWQSDQTGERVYDEEVNVLTVVANESYHDYAEHLQNEYVADGDAPPPAPTDARRRKDAIRNDRIFYHNEHFQAFWAKLNRRLAYRLHVDTPTLIEECVVRLNRQRFLATCSWWRRARLYLARSR